MIRRILAVWLAAAIPALAHQVSSDDLTSGQALAVQIRNAVPDEASQVQGTLSIKAGGQTRTVPVTCRVAVHDAFWETDYDVAATANAGAEKLIVIHRTNAPNEYLYARAPSPAAPLPEPVRLSQAEAAATPLAGSDFSAADLGLDFLHWPQQRRLKNEMRLGQPCYVLESSDKGAKGIVRVKSYIDKETSGLLIATGYDADGTSSQGVFAPRQQLQESQRPLAVGEDGDSRSQKALANGTEV